MAEIIDDTEWRSCSSNKGDSPKWIGIVELPADVNQMIRSEKVINIRTGLEKKGRNIVSDSAPGEDLHVFVFQSRDIGNVETPEKAEWDWNQDIEPYDSKAIGPDDVVNPAEYA